MPRKRKPTVEEPMPAGVPPITEAVLKHFSPELPLTGADVEAAGRRFKQALIEGTLGAELNHHLGYAPGDAKPDATTTTNGLESVNARIRKIIKARGHFPTDEAATKLIWLALSNIAADWTRSSITENQP